MLVYASGQHCNGFFIDNTEGVVFPGDGLVIIGTDQFPPLELDVKILPSLSQHIDEGQIVIEHSKLIFPSKAKNSLVLDVVPQIALNFVGVDNFMMGYLLVELGVVVDSKYEGIEDISSCEGYKVYVLAVSLFLVYATANHQSASE